MEDTIKKLAREMGFNEVGITRPALLIEGEDAIGDWIREERHGNMKYLENFRERQEKFYRDFPDAKSVIVLGVNYYSTSCHSRESGDPFLNQNGSPIKVRHKEGGSVRDFWRTFGDDMSGRVARYAWGKDYHQVIGARHQQLIAKLKETFGENFSAKSCVDTQPIPERFAAVQAGFGFIGKHTGLLNQKFGPWLFLSEIVTNLELETDLPSPYPSPARGRGKYLKESPLPLGEGKGEGGCGICDHCQKICPTGALDQDYKIDARLCIAYLTIEHKGIIPRELRPKIKNWIFGCDECMTICPFTSKQKETTWSELKPEAGPGEWLDMAELFNITSNSVYEKKFYGTALTRASRKQMLRNACIVLGNSGREEAIQHLEKAMHDAVPLVRLHAAWALGRLDFPESEKILRSHLEEENDAEVRSEIHLSLAERLHD